MRGLIAPLQRKNGWTPAEEAGHDGPDWIQPMLDRIEWDADEVLDDMRGYVVEHLGDPDAVLIVDDTGFLKRGVQSAGVQRQYSLVDTMPREDLEGEEFQDSCTETLAQIIEAQREDREPPKLPGPEQAGQARG